MVAEILLKFGEQGKDFYSVINVFLMNKKNRFVLMLLPQVR